VGQILLKVAVLSGEPLIDPEADSAAPKARQPMGAPASLVLF